MSYPVRSPLDNRTVPPAVARLTSAVYEQLGLALLAFFLVHYLNDRQLAAHSVPQLSDSMRAPMERRNAQEEENVPKEMRDKLEGARAATERKRHKPELPPAMREKLEHARQSDDVGKREIVEQKGGTTVPPSKTEQLSPEDRQRYEHMMEQKRVSKMSKEEREKYLDSRRGSSSRGRGAEAEILSRGKEGDKASSMDRDDDQPAQEKMLERLPPDQRAKYLKMLEQKRLAKMTDEEREAYMQDKLKRREQEKENARMRELDKMGLGSSGLSIDEKEGLAA